MTTFTKGPWTYGFPNSETRHGTILYEDWGTIRADDGYVVARASTGRFRSYYLNECRRDNRDPTEADSRLISAAPELLEALEELCKNSATARIHDDLEMWARAEAALAKARGVKEG